MRSLALVFIAGCAMAQFPGLSLPPSGGNQKATVVQHIGPVQVSIDYSSPAVHAPDGSDRRGKIWGGLVPYGLTNLGFGNGKPAPWRAGANENTVFAVTHDVLINGKPLAAGKYGLHMIAGPEEWTIIFSKNAQSWGSFFYETGDDALRIAVKPKKHDYREWLTYEFPVRKYTETAVEMQWEDLAVGWTIAAPNVDEILVSRLKYDLQNEAGFGWQGYLAAVNYLLQKKVHLNQALEWVNTAVDNPFIGQKNFSTLNAKSQVLSVLKRDDEAKQALLAALNWSGTSAAQIHQVGRQMLAAGKPKEAMEVFELNQKRNGDAWPVHVGLARGLAANGDKKAALEHAKLALAQAPDELNKKALADMIEQLSAN